MISKCWFCGREIDDRDELDIHQADCESAFMTEMYSVEEGDH